MQSDNQHEYLKWDGKVSKVACYRLDDRDLIREGQDSSFHHYCVQSPLDKVAGNKLLFYIKLSKK
jgi:hypothetical protein